MNLTELTYHLYDRLHPYLIPDTKIEAIPLQIANSYPALSPVWEALKDLVEEEWTHEEKLMESATQKEFVLYELKNRLKKDATLQGLLLTLIKKENRK